MEAAAEAHTKKNNEHICLGSRHHKLYYVQCGAYKQFIK